MAAVGVTMTARKTGTERNIFLLMPCNAKWSDKAEASWRQLPMGGLRFKEIPTLNMLLADEESVEKFVKVNPTFQQLMVKPSDEAASVGQAVVPIQNVPEILSYLGKAYIAQPFFKQHKILTIDFLAVEGEVKGHHCFYVDGPIENRHWKEGLYQQVVCNAPQAIREEFDEIKTLIEHLTKSVGLNGIFEVEFLYDGFHSYFLELNLLPGLYGIDDQGLMPVIEQVIIPYLQHFHIDIEQKMDFHFGPKGQFYPPSGKSAPYYKAHYGLAVDDESTSTDLEEDTWSDQAACSLERESSLEQSNIFLLMPCDAKWSDKAVMIQDYLQRMHRTDIPLVSEPPSEDGILISLEKDNLISAVHHLKDDSSKLDALVLEDANLYKVMDDKAEASWRQLPMGGLRFKEIPTLNMLLADAPAVENFVKANPTFQQLMVKPSDEAASVGQEIISVHDSAALLRYLGRPYIAQPFFKQHKILTIDFLAVEGVVE